MGALEVDAPAVLDAEDDDGAETEVVDETPIDCAPTPGWMAGWIRINSRYAITATMTTNKKASVIFL